jgi:hypothetical protein
MLPRKAASVLVRAVAHDPPKCERFGDKIMRFLKKKRARSDAKPASTFADRALAFAPVPSGDFGRLGQTRRPFVHDMF